MDIQNVALAHWCDVLTVHITLYIVVLIDDCDYLLLRQVEDIRATSNIQRTGLRWRYTVDGKVPLSIGEIAISNVINNNTRSHFLTFSVVATDSTGYAISTIDCVTIVAS